MTAEQARRVLRRAADTYVYAIQVGEDGPIKIGTAKNPRDRLRTLQTANAQQLRGRALWWGSLAEEKLWHREFATHRLVGEWFAPAQELLDLIDFLGVGGACEWHAEEDCLMTDADLPVSGTCKACGIQFFDDDESEVGSSCR